MAVISLVINKHQLKKDGTYNIKFRVIEARKIAWIASEYNIPQKLVDAKMQMKVKDNPFYKAAMTDLFALQSLYATHSDSLKGKSAKFIAEFLHGKSTGKATQDESLMLDKAMEADIKLAAKENIRRIRVFATNKVKEYLTAMNAAELTSEAIVGIETSMAKDGYSSSTIAITISQLSRVYRAVAKAKGLKPASEIFNTAKSKRITSPAESWSAGKIRRFIEYTRTLEGSQSAFACDVFEISFLLCGANPADIYSMRKPQDGVIIYERTKTKNRTEDKSRVEVKIQPELGRLIEKYKGNGETLFNFNEKYASYEIFSGRATTRMTQARQRMPDEFNKVTIYTARHSWADIAEELDVSIDVISMALGHSLKGSRMTRTYTGRKKYWKIDKANRKVIDFVYYGIVPEGYEEHE